MKRLFEFFKEHKLILFSLSGLLTFSWALFNIDTVNINSILSITVNYVNEEDRTEFNSQNVHSGIKFVSENLKENLNSGRGEAESTYSGRLERNKEVNSYRFNLEEDSCINITFRADISELESRNRAYTLAVRNSEGHVLSEKIIYGQHNETTIENLYLRRGTYYADVHRGITNHEKPYELVIRKFINSISEAEENDTPDTANNIPLDEDIKASFSLENDKDYFTFTLYEACYLKPELIFMPVKNKNGWLYHKKLYTLTVHNKDTGKSREFDFLGDGKRSGSSGEFLSEAGNYVIRIRRIMTDEINFSPHDYTLHLHTRSIK